MKKTFNIWILFVSIFIILPVFDAKAGWIDIPTVFNNLFVEEGPDGTLGTADDILCISSGYADGTYEGLGGEDLTANVSMLSKVWPIAPNQWRYHWKITNTGTGPFVDYVDTGNGPNFLQDPPLAAQETEVDTLVGGRPKIGHWGGRWNPEMEPASMRYDPTPVPEPSTLLLLGNGLLGLGLVWLRKKKDNGVTH